MFESRVDLFIGYIFMFGDSIEFDFIIGRS